MKFDPEFNRAVSELPTQEKDKLLFRLLKRDKILADRLYFQLLSGDSVQDRRLIVEKKIKKDLAKISNSTYSHAYLLREMKSLSGEITEHVKVTKDKYGEASLNLLMLNEALRKKGNNTRKVKQLEVYKFGIYVISRTFKILMLIKALHEDFLVEFEDGLKELSELIGDNPNLMHIAMHNGLDVNWLYRAEIPDDIVAIHKNLRDNGFLR